MTHSLDTLDQGFTALLKYKWTWIVTGLAILWDAAIFFDWSPYLRGPSSNPAEWRWSHVWPPDIVIGRLPLPLLVTGVIILWGFRTSGQSRLRFGHVLVLAGLALMFRLAVQYVNVNGLSIVARVLNPSYFGYFLPATRVHALGPFLATYADVQSQLGYRVGTHPPGNIIFYWSIIQIVNALPFLGQFAGPFVSQRMAEAPGWMANYTVSNVLGGAAAALLVPLCSCLSIIPLYYAACRITNDRTARLAVLLWALLPATTVFIPVIDDFYTLLGALAFWLVVNGLTKGNSWYLSAAGVAVGLGLFQSFSIIPLAVFMGLSIVLQHLAQSSRAWSLVMKHGLAFAFGAALLWGIIWLVFGLSPVRVYLNALGNYDAGVRSYWRWLIYNPYDLLLFAGAPIAVYFISSIAHLLRRALARQPFSSFDYWQTALMLTIGLVFLSGNLRGETARILLFVFPFLALIAAQSIESSARPRLYPALLIILTSIQTLVFQISLVTYH